MRTTTRIQLIEALYNAGCNQITLTGTDPVLITAVMSDRSAVVFEWTKGRSDVLEHISVKSDKSEAVRYVIYSDGSLPTALMTLIAWGLA